jgi:hypothetical protein
LLSNIDLEQRAKVLTVLAQAKRDLKSLPSAASDEDARKAFANVVKPLVEVSKCPDFVVNRGHYFGTDYFNEEPGLSDQDKRALIEFLKTL